MARVWWQAPCGCNKSYPKPNWKPWYYKPQLYWTGWKDLIPFGFGGDEFCRWTITIGWCFTGVLIVPYRYCKGCEDCGPRTYDYLPEIDSEEEANRKLDYYEA